MFIVFPIFVDGPLDPIVVSVTSAASGQFVPSTVQIYCPLTLLFNGMYIGIVAVISPAFVISSKCPLPIAVAAVAIE
jgi:hypothetical protein